MFQFLLRMSFIVCMISLCVSVAGQSVILLEQDSVSQIYQDVDISNPNETFHVEVFYKNNTEDTISLHWKRVLSENCPSFWDITTSDQYFDYTPVISESVVPIQMTPIDSHFIVRHTIWPNQLEGCCDMRTYFFLENDLDNPIDTAYFHVEINSENCTTTATNDILEEDVLIYPNPVKDILVVQSEAHVNTYKIYNAYGVLEIQENNFENNRINISGMANGIYFLELKSKDENRTIKKFIKI